MSPRPLSTLGVKRPLLALFVAGGCFLAGGAGLPAAHAAPKAAKAAKAPASAAPDDGLPKPEVVAEQARTVFADLEGNADTRIRTAVFEGRVALGKDDRLKALQAAMGDSFWPLRERALVLSLGDKDKKTHDAALTALGKLLASNDKPEREHGAALVARTDLGLKPADVLKLWQGAVAEGVPETRAEAREAIVKLGGKPGWDILAAGLVDAPDSKEFLQAVALLADFKDAYAGPWGLSHINDKDQLGTLARALLVRVDDTNKKISGDVVKSLQKIYDKAEFAERVNAATVLSLRGQGTPAIGKSLGKAAKFTDPAVRLVGLEGLREVHDAAVLGELRERIATNENEDEAKLAYAWLGAWAKATGDKAVIDLLQDVSRSDRRLLRLLAMDTLGKVAHRPSVALFESAMAEGQMEVRLSAARGLRAVARAGDEKRLGEFLRKEPEATVKLELVGALAAIGTPEILDPLQFVIPSPQVELRRAAIAAIGPIGSAKAGTLLSMRRADVDLDTRFATWTQLIHVDPRAALKDMKGAYGWMTASQIQALAADPKVTVDIMEMIALDGNDDQRGFAVDGLITRGEASATRLLGLTERSDHEETAAAAMTGLATVRKDASVPTYRDGLKHRFGMVRAASVEGLGNYGPEPILELVLPMISDKEPLVRAQAALAAVRLSTRKPTP